MHLQAQNLMQQGLLLQGPDGSWRAVNSLEEHQQLLAQRAEEEQVVQ